MQIPITEIVFGQDRRRLDPDHVKKLADSIRELGLLNPITIDQCNRLIAGLHRLEAARLLGWEKVECNVCSLDGLQAELAEIDENIIRSDLPAIEYGEMLLRRKEIYESIHPETRHGGDRKSREIKCAKSTLDTVKSFVDDTAEKLNVNPCTVRRQLQTARNLTPEAKEIMKSTDTPISRKTALELSRLEPGPQKEAAALLAAKEIRTVDEYVAGIGGTVVEKEAPSGRNAESTGLSQESAGLSPENQDTGREKPEEGSIDNTGPAEDNLGDMDETHGQQDVSLHADVSPDTGGASLKEIIAQLKDPNKDCSGTPESFLAEYDAFVRKFHREIGWYSNSYYDTVYPSLSRGQLDSLRRMTDAICSEAEALFERAAQMRKS